jgi:hypothetical protein
VAPVRECTQPADDFGKVLTALQMSKDETAFIALYDLLRTIRKVIKQLASVDINLVRGNSR